LGAKTVYEGSIAIGSAASVFVVWEIRTTVDGNSDVFFAESRDGGGTFASQDLTRAPWTKYDNAMGPEVAVGANSVFVTWAGGPFRSEVFFTRSPK
jgi:hypothetical protein